MPEEINSFDVFKQMAAENKDVRLASLDNLVRFDKTGDTCTITIGVDEKTLMDFTQNKQFVGGLLLADANQFTETRRGMIARADGKEDKEIIG